MSDPSQLANHYHSPLVRLERKASEYPVLSTTFPPPSGSGRSLWCNWRYFPYGFSPDNDIANELQFALIQANEEWRKARDGTWDWRNIDDDCFLLAVFDKIDDHLSNITDHYEECWEISKYYKLDKAPRKRSCTSVWAELLNLIPTVYQQAVAQLPRRAPPLPAAIVFVMDAIRWAPWLHERFYIVEDSIIPPFDVDLFRLGRFTKENYGWSDFITSVNDETGEVTYKSTRYPSRIPPPFPDPIEPPNRSASDVPPESTSSPGIPSVPSITVEAPTPLRPSHASGKSLLQDPAVEAVAPQRPLDRLPTPVASLHAPAPQRRPLGNRTDNVPATAAASTESTDKPQLSTDKPQLSKDKIKPPSDKPKTKRAFERLGFKRPKRSSVTA